MNKRDVGNPTQMTENLGSLEKILDFMICNKLHGNGLKP